YMSHTVSCIPRFALFSLFLPRSVHLLHLHSFPTRRSSDLPLPTCASTSASAPPPKSTNSKSSGPAACARNSSFPVLTASCKLLKDRKSTRLNSSHVAISYAVFCLKKKKKKSKTTHVTTSLT